jgi:hypothetical protein
MTHTKLPCEKSAKKNQTAVGVLRNPFGLSFATIVQAALATGLIVMTVAASEPESKNIEKHIKTLASTEFGGRSGEVAAKSRTYIIDEFKRLKLEPLFENNSYLQDIPDREPGWLMGRNVGAKLVGSDPKLKDEWVIVAAHFDHLGVRNGVLYPGADDNASACAMMLEVARCLAEDPVKPKRSVMLIGFDLEERGLFGSRYFVEHSPIPLDKIALFMTADMIGRALGGVCKPHVFVMGTEHVAPGQAWVKAAAKGKPLTIGILGADLLLLDRSDYGPFRTRKIPFLFFSTGENPCYHTPRDVAETIDFPKATAISQVMYTVARKAMDVSERPIWQVPKTPQIEEAKTLKEVFTLLLANRETLKIGRTPVFLMENSQKSLDTIMAKGELTSSERIALIRVAQIVMAAVF